MTVETRGSLVGRYVETTLMNQVVRRCEVVAVAFRQDDEQSHPGFVLLVVDDHGELLEWDATGCRLVKSEPPPEAFNGPRLEMPRAELAAGIPLVDLIARTVMTANADARRLVAQGGAFINGIRSTIEDRIVTPADLRPDGTLTVGTKAQPWLLRVVD